MPRKNPWTLGSRWIPTYTHVHVLAYCQLQAPPPGLMPAKGKRKPGGQLFLPIITTARGGSRGRPGWPGLHMLQVLGSRPIAIDYNRKSWRRTGDHPLYPARTTPGTSLALASVRAASPGRNHRFDYQSLSRSLSVSLPLFVNPPPPLFYPSARGLRHSTRFLVHSTIPLLLPPLLLLRLLTS